MQISSNTVASQTNLYAQAQTRDANPLAAAAANRQQPVQPQTATAVTAAAEGLKANNDRREDAAAEVTRQAAQSTRVDAPGTRRGSLIDIVA